MSLDITFNEKQLTLLSKLISEPNKELPSELMDKLALYNGLSIGKKLLKDFLIIEGKFQFARAVSRIVIRAQANCNSSIYYLGQNGWRNGLGKVINVLHINSYWGTGWITVESGRMDDFDETFNLAKENGSVPELFKALIDEVHKTNKFNNQYFKAGLIGWIIENDFHKNEDIIKQFLRGYFVGDEKTQIMKALIEDKELDSLELFWKSRAFAVKSMLIEHAPIEELPFRLATKDQRLLKMIEKKMENK